MSKVVLRVIICLFLLAADCYILYGGQFAIDEDFDSLDRWEPVVFPKIEKRTEYDIEQQDGKNVLVARSNDSASGLRYVDVFDVYRYPVVRWRWKVRNVYEKGDLASKDGDDYSLRVYVNFQYDPEKASLKDRMVYGFAKAVYGEYPPRSSLSYIWANKDHEKIIYPSPYTDKAKLIIVRSGKADTGEWMEEEVDILEDYRKAFGKSPPAKASIAIMNDSDNTGESSVSYLDYIQVLNK